MFMSFLKFWQAQCRARQTLCRSRVGRYPLVQAVSAREPEPGDNQPAG
jgi:hypothetical protein